MLVHSIRWWTVVQRQEMSHYSEHPDHIRVDFFKQNGSWYTTEEVEWVGPWKAEGAKLIYDQFAETLIRHLRGTAQDSNYIRLSDMLAVCLEPYHENAFPLMMYVKDAIRLVKEMKY